MPAIISGTIFNDLNSNGIFNVGEPGIPNAFVVLRDPSGNCSQVQSSATGAYSFTGLTVAGAYTIYETVVTQNACPPTAFTQPTGFNESTTPRQINLNVSATNISGNATLSGNNYGHDNLTANGCTPFAYQVQGSPTTFTQIDLKTGGTTTLGTLNPSSTFGGTGYNSIDGNFWGMDIGTGRVGRITANRTVTLLPAVPNLTTPTNKNCGDVNLNGYLYLYGSSESSFFVVDVNPNRATYGRLVNPATGFTEQTVAPFGVAIPAVPNISDWAFNPQDGNLYAVSNANGTAIRINPTTGAVTSLTTTPATIGTYGASFFDNNNNLYEIDNTSGQVFKYAISGTTATRTFFSQSVVAGTNDGARCATAPITFAFLTSTKSAPGNVGIGETFTYTVVIKNTGNESSTNCIFIDTIPDGASFVASSLKVNNVSRVGSPVPPGVELGSIPIGTTTVTFSVIVNTIPSPNPMQNNSTASYSFQDGPGGGIFNSAAYSNTATTTVNYVFFPFTKTVDRTNATTGTTLTYTIVSKNTGNFTASNVVIIDTIPAGTAFVGGSVTGGTGSPQTGISVGTILAGGVSTVTFKVTIVSVPSPNPIVNNATGTFNFIPNPQTGTVSNGGSISSANTLVSYADLSGITKSVDKAFANCGDTITYTIVVPNTGLLTAQNVIFKDTIPNGTVLVPSSVFVNNVSASGANPNSGITIPNIAPGGTATLTFSVVVSCL